MIITFFSLSPRRKKGNKKKMGNFSLLEQRQKAERRRFVWVEDDFHSQKLRLLFCDLVGFGVGRRKTAYYRHSVILWNYFLPHVNSNVNALRDRNPSDNKLLTAALSPVPNSDEITLKISIMISFFFRGIFPS